MKRAVALALLILVLVPAAALRWAPQTVVYLALPFLPMGAAPAPGGDYFAVEAIDAQTYAIREPRYWQQNASYLLLGADRAVLFDAGTGRGDIAAAVRGLTKLPVQVMVSHLHYDHTGGLAAFDDVALLDLQHLKAQVGPDGWFTPSGEQHLGAAEDRPAPRFKVKTWLAPDAVLELGGRRLRVWRAPGHTPESMMLHDEARRQLFTGDFIYRGQLYAILPGADLRAYRHTAALLAAGVSPDTTLYPGHGSPLARADLIDLHKALDAVCAGEARPHGVFPRIYPVNARISLAAPFAASVDCE